MDINKKIINAIKDSRTIPEDGTVIVGFSGGPDSMCLLHALAELAKTCPIRIVALHVNHKLRDNADAEAENARKFCEDLGIEFREKVIDCAGYAKEKGISTEEAGRLARYRLFDELADEYGASSACESKDAESIRIAVAHNADDQAETVLFRLIRGTGIHGAAGIRKIRKSEKGYFIVRPILSISRADIEMYIAENNLRPNIDESNEIPDVSRNKIRLELIPYIEKNFNPNVKEALVRFAELADIDDRFIESESEGLESAGAEEIAMLNDALKTRTIARMIDRAGLHEGVTQEHINSVAAILDSDNPSASVDLPHNYVAARDYDRIAIGRRGDILAGDSNRVTNRLTTKIIDIDEYRRLEYERRSAAFDFDAFDKAHPGMVSEIVLRTRKEGDFLAIKGGRKKLQDYFVDAKISKKDRDKVAVAAIGSEILWIVDTDRLSHNFHINETTQRVIFLELETLI